MPSSRRSDRDRGRPKASKSPPRVASGPSSTRPWMEGEEEQELAPAGSPRTSRRARRRQSNPDTPLGSGLDDSQSSMENRRRSARRRGSASSAHSASSTGSGHSPKPRRHKPSSVSADDAGSRTSSTSRTSYSERMREQRKARLLEDQPGDEAHPPRSTRSINSNTATATEVNPEDEIERIREMRARRLRSERLERGGTSSELNASRSKSPPPPDSRTTSIRERRRDRENVRDRGVAGALPSKNRSTPLISRRELEDAGLVRKDRRTRDATSPRPNRMQSEVIGSDSNRQRRRELSPNTSRRGLRDDDDLSAYSRSRRDRERGGADDDSSSYSRSRAGDADEISAYSRSSDQPTRDSQQRYDQRLAARRARRAEENAGVLDSSQTESDHLDVSHRSNLSTSSRDSYQRDRHIPPRGNTGVDDKLAARDRRPPPPRSRSADQDLLTMGLNKHSDPDLQETPSTRPVNQQRAPRTRSTDLTARLRERREARAAAEREARSTSTPEAPSASRKHGTEVDRRLARRRSSDNMELMSMSNAARGSKQIPQSTDAAEDGEEMEVTETIPDLELSSLSAGSSGDSSSLSVRITVMSALDLPQNVVPNMPLCPVIKIGFVRLPPGGGPSVESAVIQKMGSRSIQQVLSARVRSTTTKIMSKRDNGSIDFNQELRWDEIQQPTQVALYVELCARAVRTPKNFDESPPSSNQTDAFLMPEPTKRIHTMVAAANAPPASSRPTDEQGNPIRRVDRTASGSDENMGTGLRAFWRKATNQKTAELEAAEAAAAVARMLVEQDKQGQGDPDHAEIDGGQSGYSHRGSAAPQSDYTVTLRPPTRKRRKTDLTEDVRLGVLVIPLSTLPLDRAETEMGRLEQWYQFESADGTMPSSSAHRKPPSVLLTMDVSSPHALDDNEEELEVGQEQLEEEAKTSKTLSTSSSALQNRSAGHLSGSLSEEPMEEAAVVDPILEPGVVDFISVMGCRDIGNQNKDDGTKGWVESSPELVIFEQFPPNNEYHHDVGRNSTLPEMVQWFCFPEGARLWRGTAPPSHADLNLKRFSASSPPNVASSIAAFDACLNSTTSFSWFVIASNSDEYGSKLVKTYGAVIRFYAPAPVGIDPTQEDFAQTVIGQKQPSPGQGLVKRLWVPVCICFTSSLPIIGVMEAMLLRLCEDLVAKVGGVSGRAERLEDIHRNLANLIVNFQKPLAGAVNCSVPFLSGDRFLLSLPPTAGLPPLPHGKAVVSVCRLLGAEGLNYLIAAILTECKILIHSQDIADIAMVAEVVTALVYPFSWSLPYIPILPLGMLEIVEAPLSYILGVPSCNLQLLDPRALDDVVVVDLDNGFSSAEYFDGRRSTSVGYKSPPPLPASVAMNISKAVYRLLRAEEEVEEEFGGANLDQSLPRLEAESLAEREFRVAVAIEVCGLLRGYQECVGRVFNRDSFLSIAPALFEDRNKAGGTRHGSGKSISGRSKRFLSLLVNTQNFQQLLENLESEDLSFFHEVMEAIDESSSDKSASRTVDTVANKEKALATLVRSLQKVEDKVPTYRVDKGSGIDEDDEYEDDDFFFDDGDYDMHDFGDIPTEPEMMTSGDGNMITSFSSALLVPIELEPFPDGEGGERQGLSMENLAKLEKTPWDYERLFAVPIENSDNSEPLVERNGKVHLRDAIGERRYRAWKMTHDQQPGSERDLGLVSDNLSASKQGVALDLTTLISSATSDMDSTSLTSNPLRNSGLTPTQQRVVDAKDRDVIRRCLDRTHRGSGLQGDSNAVGDLGDIFIENGRDLMAESEKALRNPSAQRFLLSILAQRSRLENQRLRTMRRQSAPVSASRLDPIAFECLVRLSCAMLDSCMEYKEYESSYRLLASTSGFIMVVEGENTRPDLPPVKHVIPMISRIGLHPIFADLGVWETVMGLHLAERQREARSDTRSMDEETDDEAEEDEIEYEAAVATLYEMVGYGIPGEELSRFAMRASEEHGWFCDDRGRQLLMLARRISIRRDQADTGAVNEAATIDMMGQDSNHYRASSATVTNTERAEHKWMQVAWCHPAAPSARMTQRGDNIEYDSQMETEDYMKRSSISALATFGSSVVVTGGLDGGVFLAHTMTETSNGETNFLDVRGIHLDWGSASRAGAGSSSDGEYGVGAVSCLSAAYGNGQHLVSPKSTKQDVSREDLIHSMEGSRVIAGTTAGDLRVWSVKDVYAALLSSKDGEDQEGDMKSGGNATRLKFSLRGRALSGHRGGVTCIDVPSQVYRPDSLVTGGADGMIKLWSLRAPTGGRRQGGQGAAAENEQQRGRGGDALNVLSGHNSRVLCVKTAWHGDRLLSGGADKSLRVWDMSASGKCLHTLFGHSGWVTKVEYWGPNTIVSASTDRSVALWDARVRSSPLFMLRHHQAPISDFLVGSRTDPLMTSAAADGTVATWDFRTLSDSSDSEMKGSQVLRRPVAAMEHGSFSKSRVPTGPVFLARGAVDTSGSVVSVGSDAVVREWDTSRGEIVEEYSTGHCDAVSTFQALGIDGERSPDSGFPRDSNYGTLSSSWDGTIRMRKLVRE